MNKHLLALDFDGLLARTFDDSPSGLNVNKASEKAVQDIFGDEGSSAYKEIGGLQGREPGELVALLQKGSGRDGVSLGVATEKFIQRKLFYLTPEISPEWPRLNAGVVELFQDVSKGTLSVDIAIVSSGHDSFISRVFEVNRIAPKFLITSDILRRRGVEGKYKPHPYQLAEAHRQWIKARPNGELTSLGINGFTERGGLKGNIAYAGDDPVKDGQMAEAARIPFIFMPLTRDGFSPQLSKGQLYLSDFFALRRILLRGSRYLREGASFSEVLFGKRDAEIFPPVPEDERPWARMVRERTV